MFRRIKIISLFVCVLIIFGSSYTSASECKLTILHFNDFHGHLETPKKGLGGGERLAALVTKIDRENLAAGRHTLLLMGGDIISGTAVSEKFKGEAEFKFLEAIGTEAMVIGNHDFDFGLPVLKKNMKNTELPVLSANIIDKNTQRLLGKATYVFPLGPECRVGVMGLTTPATPLETGADLGSLVFQDPIKYAGYYIDDLVDQTEVRIALTHMGSKKDVELAKRVPGFNVVIGGHDHGNPEDYCRVSKGIPVCQTPSKGRYLGRIDLTARDGKIFVENTKLIPVDKKAGKSKEVRQLLSVYLDKVKKSMSEVVTTVGRDFPHRPRKGALTQVPLGGLVADAMRVSTKADVAFVNTGGIRKAIKKGKVTKNDIFEALPFQNYVGVIDLTGQDLIKVIEIAERRANPERPQPYLNWSGLKYKKLDSEYEVVISGKPLVKNKTYRAATIDFLASGKDGYYILKDKDYKTSGKVLREVFEHYIKSRDL